MAGTYGSMEPSPARPRRQRISRAMVAMAAALAMTCAACVVVLLKSDKVPAGGEVELMGSWTKPRGIGIDTEPYSAPANLYLYWGSTVNKRFTGSGEHVRHVFKMGSIEGGEYRDPKFVRSIEGGMFNALSSRCCSSMVFPPMEWDFPVYNANKIVGQNIRAFVANGNSMILTGGLLNIEFINRYFFYQLELADGNYSPGPFRELPQLMGMSEEQNQMLSSAPKSLPQVGISVTAVKKASLPSGATIIYGTPHNAGAFAIKFCMAENPANDASTQLPPVKVLPRDCEASAKAGRPCSCGFLCYMGYNWQDRYPSRWDTALKSVQQLCSVVPPENNDPRLLSTLKLDPIDNPIKPAAGPQMASVPAAPVAREPEAKKEEEEKKEKKEAGKPGPPGPPGARGPRGLPGSEEVEVVKEVVRLKGEAKRGCEGDLCGKDFGKEDGCGPLCKLQELVKKLTS